MGRPGARRRADRPTPTVLEQPRRRRGRGEAGVQQHERAGAVGVLAHPRVHARLAEERRLLVARDPRDRHRVPVQRLGARVVPSAPGAGAHLAAARARARRTAPAAPGPSAPRSDVVEHRARRVRGVGDVLARELVQISHESTVPNSARPARARSRSPSTCSSSHCDLRGREVRVEHQPGARADQPLVPGLAQLRDSAPPCAGPARRSRGAAAHPSPGPTRTPSRAGW